MSEKNKIMGILNVTPDSFYDGGKFNGEKTAKVQIKKMIEEGVDIIDVGGFSSKPGSKMPSIDKELSRVLPILDILEKYDVEVSVDTCRSKVVEKILKYKNLKYINDISGLSDEKIIELIKGKNISYILMHTQGVPETMQNNPEYGDVVKEVGEFFEEKLKIIENICSSHASKKIDFTGDIILDPGFGFGKNIKHNYDLLQDLDYFQKFDLAVLAGLSRKSMMYKFLDSSPDKVLPETVALNLFALQKGASILRVHDVEEHKNIVKIFNLMNNLK